MKYLKLFESYKSQKELEILTTDILRYWGDIYYVEIQKNINLKKEVGQNSSNPFTKYKIESVYFYNFKDEVDMKKYDELRDFIRTSKTYIQFHKRKTNTLGSQHKTVQGQEINIYLNESFLKDLNIRLDEGKIKNGDDIYFLAHYECYSTLLHELQHAYDRHRSNGKAFKYPKGYFKDYEEQNSIRTKSKHTPLSDNEIDFLNKQTKIYKNLKHEIDARYTQALNNIRAIKMDWDKKLSDVREYYIEDWEKFYSQFKSELDGWNDLSVKDKRSLTRRLSQFYEFEKEEVKHKNNKLREKRKGDNEVY